MVVKQFSNNPPPPCRGLIFSRIPHLKLGAGFGFNNSLTFSWNFNKNFQVRTVRTKIMLALSFATFHFCCIFPSSPPQPPQLHNNIQSTVARCVLHLTWRRASFDVCFIMYYHYTSLRWYNGWDRISQYMSFADWISRKWNIFHWLEIFSLHQGRNDSIKIKWRFSLLL